LAGALEAFYSEFAPQAELRLRQELFHHYFREKLAALGLAVALWMVVVHRSQVVQRSFEIPVQYGLLGTNLVVRTVQPDTITVTFSAPRKEFDFLRAGDIKLVLQLWDARRGQRQFRITSNELSYPPKLDIDDIEPRQVTLNIDERPPSPNGVKPTP